LDLNSVIDKVIAPYEEPAKKKTLVVLDGLDEYNDSLDSFMTRLEQFHASYPNCKIMITTRFVPSILDQTRIDLNEYIRLLLFTEDQVNDFFKKYNSTLTYNYVSDLRVKKEEITKPLFTWLLSILFAAQKLEINPKRDIFYS
jgi:hypothetical protein